MTRFNLLGKVVAGALCALLLASCGQFFPGSNTIVALSVSPASAQVKPGASQQFTATATYGNNNTGDVTSSVTWISSNTAIATINSGGLATAGVTLGTANITCKSGSVTSGIGKLLVSNKTISVITVSPQNITLSSGSGQQYTASATYSDGSNGDVTNSVTWTSSNTVVASITTSGFAQAISTGTTTISAALGGVLGTSTLTVQ